MQAMAMMQIEEEIDPELLCEVHEDGPCRGEAVRVVQEIFTPGRFKVRCCASHAEDLISQGYKPVNGMTTGRIIILRAILPTRAKC